MARSKRKHANGEGGRTKRRGGLLQYTFYVPQPDGTKKRVYKYTRSKSEGEEWLAEMRYKTSKGELILESDTPLGEYIVRWISDFCINIRLTTLSNYHLYLRHLQRHSIGSVPLRKLTTVLLQDFIRFLIQAGRIDGYGGLSAKTVRNIIQMIRQALQQAVACNLISRNPAEYIVLPRAQQPVIEVLSVSELRQLIQTGINDPWGISLVLLATTGIRLGELLALRKDCICDRAGICFLDIHATLQRITVSDRSRDAPKTEICIGPPKTTNGFRQIPVTPEVMTLLKLYLQNQESRAKKAYGLFQDNPFLICNEVGNYIDPSNFRRWFRSIVTRAGLQRRVYPHLLRHTWASLALKAEVDLKTLSDTLGHYDPSFSARRYVHGDLPGRAAILDKMRPLTAALLSSVD